MQRNDELTKQLRAALEADSAIDLSHNPIQIAVQDGTARLSGEVTDIATKRRAHYKALGIDGISGIDDHIRVRPSEHRGDDAIRQAVYETEQGEPAFRDFDIGLAHEPPPTPESGRTDWMRVGVEDGVVTLTGITNSLTHKRLADALAWWTIGVVDVKNRIHVEPPERDSDAEITDALRMILEKDPWLNDGQINVRTEARSVTLTGLVASPEQRHMAENDAWTVLGVHGVHNLLEVRPMTSPSASSQR
jgi:osmotically-inducible protein OsmY